MNTLFASTTTLFVFVLLFTSCPDGAITAPTPEPEEEEEVEESALVAVTEVTVSGNEGAYSFAVEISSPDEDCDQYANWWEVVATDGTLLYRRILGHSHVDEQPFTRSGGPVPISDTQEVWIRGHMNNTGYSTKAFKGSVANGFSPEDTTDGFASELETSAPLPDRCAF